MGNNILDSVEPKDLLWNATTIRKVNLCDLMKKYHAHKIFDIQFLIAAYRFEEIADRVERDEPLGKEDIKTISMHLRGLADDFEFLNLGFTLKYLNDIQKKIISAPITFNEFDREIEILSGRIDHQIEELVFGFIPKEKGHFFEAEKLFGNTVFDNFPSAREEIKEAGNCYALNVNTACVFHLMRVVEIGARAMYWQMTKRKNVVIEKYKKGAAKKMSKSIPMELCDWNTLIKGFNIALEKLEAGKSKSIIKNQNHAYFNRLVKIFDNFRSGWRNVISHGNEIDSSSKRTLFKEGETSDLMRDTERFMRLLAERVMEKL